MEEAYKEKRNTYRKRVTERREREGARERWRMRLISCVFDPNWFHFSRQGSEEGGKQFIKLKAEKQKRETKKQQTKTKIKWFIQNSNVKTMRCLVQLTSAPDTLTHTHSNTHTPTDTYRVKNCCFCWPKDWSHFKQADDQILCKPLTFCKQYRSSHRHTHTHTCAYYTSIIYTNKMFTFILDCSSVSVKSFFSWFLITLRVGAQSCYSLLLQVMSKFKKD